jgi:hypothetical protein
MAVRPHFDARRNRDIGGTSLVIRPDVDAHHQLS